MAVPDFQSLMLPVLKTVSDGKIYTMRSVIEKCADMLSLDDNDRKEMLPSGRQYKFDNRIHWAKKYLLESGLLESPERGRIKISKRGLDVLSEKPLKINIKYLERFPEYLRFRNISNKNRKIKDLNTEPNNEISEESILTPLETLERSFNEIQNSLASELLNIVREYSPYLFEKLVVDLLEAMGYGGFLKGAGEVTAKSSDEGIDGLIKEDKLGLDIIYIQAKRWKNSVGRPEIQNFVGSLVGKQSSKGVFITTSGFTKGAYEYAEKIPQKVILIDGESLAKLMIEYDVGVSKSYEFIVKKIDYDYFED